MAQATRRLRARGRNRESAGAPIGKDQGEPSGDGHVIYQVEGLEAVDEHVPQLEPGVGDQHPASGRLEGEPQREDRKECSPQVNPQERLRRVGSGQSRHGEDRRHQTGQQDRQAGEGDGVGRMTYRFRPHRPSPICSILPRATGPWQRRRAVPARIERARRPVRFSRPGAVRFRSPTLGPRRSVEDAAR